MKKLILLGAAMLLLAVAARALAQEAVPAPQPAPVSATETAHPPCTPAKQIYSLKHWHRARPGRGRHVCPTTRRSIRKLKARYADYRIYRRVAIYPGPGHGPRSPADGRWWAIPYCVVAGESGNFREPNGDGAYQIIPSTWAAYGGTRFAPIASQATPLEQHIVAARARRGGTAWYGGCGLNA